jgi:hypothetical protein
MSDYYCKYCIKHWKHKQEYEKHLACCEFFYNFRRNPRNEMDDYGNKLPTQKELFRFVQELSMKCERLEKEVTRLKQNANMRQKKIIVECLNHSSAIPKWTFCEWWKSIHLSIPFVMNEKDASSMAEHWSEISNPYLFRVFNMGLTEGIKCILGQFIGVARESRQILPIRCFTQKINTFYIYCGEGIPPYEDKIAPAVMRPQFPAKSGKRASEWKIMSNADLETMVDYISQIYVREFLGWLNTNSYLIGQDERRGEEQISYMMKVNSMRPSKEKGMVEVRKWLFATLEENAQKIGEVEFI